MLDNLSCKSEKPIKPSPSQIISFVVIFFIFFGLHSGESRQLTNLVTALAVSAHYFLGLQF